MTLRSPLEEPMADTGWTIPGLLIARSNADPDATAHWHRAADGRWIASSWNDFRNACAAVATGLVRNGLKPGDRVGIMAASCREWDYAQIGILAAGGIAVGLDPHAIDEHIRAIAEQCDLAGVILGNPELLSKLGNRPHSRLRFIVFMDRGDDASAIDLSTLISESIPEDNWNRSEPDAVATIIFTSGTTGEPKGIAYSHRQVCLAVTSILSAFPDITDGSRLACWLPLSNLFQRMINFCAMGRGAQTFYVSDPRDIMRLIPEIAPHVFIGVPRFYEKLYTGMQQAIARKPRWQQAMVRWAWQVGNRHAAALRGARSRVSPSPWAKWTLRLWQLRLADRLVLRKLRHVLGNNLRFMISGSAPMPTWLLERFHAIGLPVLEAYGLSENIIPVSLNRPDNFRFGTVGQPLPGCEVGLAEDGELRVRGPGVFKTYLGDDQDNPRVDRAGFLMSGDFATIDEDGFITLVGRKSEIFKTSTGRRVAPSSIENLLRQVQGVEFAAVFGAGRTQPTALLVIGETVWNEPHDQLSSRLVAEVARALEPLPPYLRPSGFAATTRMFSIAGGELTANLKLRRRTIEDHYNDVLNELHMHLDEACGTSFKTFSKDGSTLFVGL